MVNPITYGIIGYGLVLLFMVLFTGISFVCYKHTKGELIFTKGMRKKLKRKAFLDAMDDKKVIVYPTFKSYFTNNNYIVKHKGSYDETIRRR